MNQAVIDCPPSGSMRFLVNSGYALGDCALDIPLLRAISRAGHHLEVIAGAAVAQIFVDCRFVHGVHEKRASVLARAGMYRGLVRQDWDVIINPRYVPRWKVLNFIGCRHRLSSADANPELFARGAALWRLSIVSGLIADWKRDIDASIPFDEGRLQVALRQCGIGSRERYLTVAPGSDRQEKIWPVANFAAVVNAVRHNFEHVVVVGTKRERGMCAQLAQACGATNCAGGISLAEACALVSGAALHLGNDSGLCHVAAGNGAPTLAVGGYGNRHYVPWNQHMIDEPVGGIETQKVLDVLHERLNLPPK